jgi:hypothetical protein
MNVPRRATLIPFLTDPRRRMPSISRWENPIKLVIYTS